MVQADMFVTPTHLKRRRDAMAGDFWLEKSTTEIVLNRDRSGSTASSVAVLIYQPVASS